MVKPETGQANFADMISRLGSFLLPIFSFWSANSTTSLSTMFEDIEPSPDMAWESSRISSSSMRSNNVPDIFGPKESMKIAAFWRPDKAR